FSFLLLLPLRSPRPTLFPYTTLFRSHKLPAIQILRNLQVFYEVGMLDQFVVANKCVEVGVEEFQADCDAVIFPNFFHAIEPHNRSEEHTSELQSHLNLVCRLLLEKKK